MALSDEADKHLYRLWYPESTTINNLMGTQIDETRGHHELEGFNLGDSLLYPFAIERPAVGFREYIVFMDHIMDGGDLNRLYYSIASNKDRHFGLDTKDIIFDRDLLNTPIFKELKETHAKELGLVWDIIQRDDDFFTYEIEKWHTRSSEPEADITRPGIIAVMRWGEKPWGEKYWIFDYLEGFPYERLRIEMAKLLHPNSFSQREAKRFNPIVGFWAVVHLAWEGIGSNWGPSVSLSRDGTGPTAPNWPRRSGGYALRQAYQFLDCKPIRRIEEYIASDSVEVDFR